MVQCFAPGCNHYSESHTCKYFRFPDEKKHKTTRAKWIALIRRQDRVPNSNSRVCSCHFRDGNKENGPEIFERNKDKLFEQGATPAKKARKQETSASDGGSSTPCASAGSNDMPTCSTGDGSDVSQIEAILNRSHTIITEHSLMSAEQEVSRLQEELKYTKFKYTVNNLEEKVIRMETGVHTTKLFFTIVDYVRRFQENIQYHHGWKVNYSTIKLEDQVFMTLMKVRQNYTNLHLAQIFGCSETTVANVILTFIHVLHHLLVEDLMTGKCPSRYKNKISAPAAFLRYPNCRMIIDCTDFEIAIPREMDKQKATYSSYRAMNTFKALVGVSPNGVINYVSKLHPGSISDKAIVQNCGILSLFDTGDLILADKGFLIGDIVPSGVTVNIPPFLQHSKFTENEVKLTKEIASCRIHVERANQRLKDFKILSFIPAMLRDKADIVFQLVAALVNLQFPLIRETAQPCN